MVDLDSREQTRVVQHGLRVCPWVQGSWPVTTKKRVIKVLEFKIHRKESCDAKKSENH